MTNKIYFVVILLSINVVINLNEFLSVTSPIKADVLVVEGWIYDKETLKDAVIEFNNGNYKILVTVGGALRIRDKTTAELAAERLIIYGIDKNQIVVINIPYQELQRTHSTAFAFNEWFSKHNQKLHGVNVFTVGVHARKSWVLFKDSLKNTSPVGIIAGKEREYNPDCWWCSGTGIQLVTRNLVGYFYALYLLW